MARKVILSSIVLSITSGILLALSYPQFNLGFFAWIALIPLLFAIENKNLLQSFGLGWLTGFTMFIGQLFWLKVFHVLVPFALSAYLALYFGLFCLLYRFIKSKISISGLLIIPIIWVSIEYIRSIGPWGFPAGLLGYSQYQNLLLIQIADVVGIFGLSFLLVFVNASLFYLIKEFSFNRATKIVPIMLIILVSAFVYGGVKMARVENDKTVRVALIQPNFSFNNEKEYNINEVIQTLDELTSQAAKEKPDLIIWPETVIRESVRLNLALSKKLNTMVNKYNSYLLFGNPDMKKVNGKIRDYNSAFLVSPKGEVVGQYNKIHPVPFWEMFPVRDYLSFLRNTEAKGSCDRGEEFTVLEFPKGRFSALICFEGIFPDLARKFVRNGAQFLVNITNDGWSKSTTEHYQHASMDVFRAVENRVYYVRVGNSGVTEVIDPYGRVVKSLPIYKNGCLVADIGLRKGDTVYTKFGDYFGYLSLILMSGMMGVTLFSKGRTGNEV
ncbi:MAG: apolipoprotein N-acyltransferase [Candidatus Auribacterota bacterium]|nr:apolipoprotein N-acyltransferase [Candidatus Auribacterota bacterium]